MGRFKLLRILLPIPLGFLASCDVWFREIVREELALAETKIATTSQSVRKVTSRLDQLEGHLAYCSDEVKSLLSKVQKECQAKDVCTPNDANIQVEVLRIDPSKQGRFLSLFQERKHLAFYFPDRARELTDVEKKALRDLIKPTWLDDGERHTRFLVVSNIEDGTTGALKRAERRSWRVIDTIAEISREMQVPAGTPAEPAPEAGGALTKSAAAPRPQGSVMLAANGTPPLPSARAASPAEPSASGGAAQAKEIVRKGRVLNWIFPFSVPGEILRPEDRPKPDEKLVRSVWVYRVDC
jgi:hypothetical protein